MCALSSASAAASPKRFASSNSSLGERGVLADPVDVERPLQRPPRATSGTTISASGSTGVPGHEADARVEMRLVREHGLAVVDRPSR